MKIFLLFLVLFFASAFSINAAEILFGGDVTLARNIINHDNFFADKARMRIHNADLFVWNCEFSGASNQKKTKQFVFSVDARNKLRNLKFRTGIALIANNHSFDGGTIGFTNLVKDLEANKIPYVGLRNSVHERNYYVITKGGKSYYLLNFSPICHNNDPIWTVPTWSDIIKSIDYINSIKEIGDIIIVNIHDGIEKSTKPSDRQISYAKKLADKNVDIVSFTHSHTYIDPSKIGDTLVLWGVGNFIFGGNAQWRDNKDVRLVSVDPDNKTWKWVKGYTQNYKFNLY